ncbi:MAG TPA: arylamine N-acetyltransferase, partial [Roseiflexaceae bacterium]|nr:arylamine N-acetyltransferase [Roseiflexaceae bacterium]
TLRGLQMAHLLAVPFENLNIGMGWPIVLDQDALFEKIVLRRRGGFCYELNGLFAALLSGLGFEITMLSAGVARAAGGFGPEFDHLTLLVRGMGEGGGGMVGSATPIPHPPSPFSWLADVGFGDSFREPLRFEEDREQRQGQRAYRLARAGEYLVLQQREGDGEWEPQYRFTLEPRRHAEFAEMCRYHQTSPESSFTRRRVCTRATPDGRVTLSDTRLITTRAGERQERELADEDEVRAVLREHFGVDLSSVT